MELADALENKTREFMAHVHEKRTMTPTLPYSPTSRELNTMSARDAADNCGPLDINDGWIVGVFDFSERPD